MQTEFILKYEWGVAGERTELFIFRVHEMKFRLMYFGMFSLIKLHVRQRFCVGRGCKTYLQAA